LNILQLIDIAADVFFAPRRGIEKAARLGTGGALCLFSVLLLLIYCPAARVFLPDCGNWLLAGLFVLKALLAVAFLLFFAFSLNGFMNVFWQKNAPLNSLLAGFVFSCLPFVLLPVLLCLPGARGWFFLIMFCLTGWTAALFLLTISELYACGVFKSLLAFCLPFMFLLAGGAVFFLYAGALLKAVW
jgi:hypothetical protein